MIDSNSGDGDTARTSVKIDRQVRAEAVSKDRDGSEKRDAIRRDYLGMVGNDA